MSHRGIATALLLLCALPSGRVHAQVSGTSVDSTVLDRVVAVSLRAAPLRVALDSIARLAHLRLSYSIDVLPPERTVTLVNERITAGAALRAVLRGTNLDVTASASDLVVIAPRGPVRALHGRVIDAVTRAPVEGVSVELEGRDAGALTSGDGTFALAVNEGAACRIVLRRIGYQTATLLVAATLPEAARDIALAPAALALDRLDVVGPRTSTAESEPAHAMTILRPAELAAVQPRTLGEVFAAAAAMLAPADGSASPRLRVTGIRGATSLALSPPKIYVDGVELAQPQYAGIIDPALIERIEIVRGPQGAALYGSDAIGGVVHIITRKGAPGAASSLGGELRSATGWLQPALGGGSTWTADQLGAGTYAGRHAAATAAASYARFGDTDDAGGRRMGAFAGVRGTATRAALEASVHFAEQTWRPSVNDVLRSYGYPILLPALDEPQRARQATAGVTLRVLPHPAWSHTLTAGHDHSALDVAPERAPQISPPDSTLASARGTSGRTSVRYTSLLRVATGDEASLLVTAGGELARLRHEAVTRIRDALPGETSTRRVGTRRDAGGFAQLELTLPRLLLSAGLRAEHSSTFGDEHGAAWLPTAGAAYRLMIGPVGARVRTAWGRAIRPAWPTGPDDSPRLHVITDPDLAPEQQTGAEVGIDIDIAGRALLHVTRFDQTVDGLIYAVKVDTTTAVRQNIGRIANRGWESELVVHLGEFTARGSHTSVDSRVVRLTRAYAGELRPGDRVPEVPAHATALTLAYERTRGSIALSAVRVGSWESYDWLRLFADRAVGTNRNPREYRITYDPLLRIDLAASTQLSSRVAAVLKVGNLTDSRRSGRDNLERVPGRSVSAGIQVR